MSVIINNMDMVVQRKDEETDQHASGKPEQPAMPQPNQDLRDILRQQVERRARLRAY